MKWCVLAVIVLNLPSTAIAAAPKLLPAEISLAGPNASHRTIIVADEQGKIIGDWTEQAKFATSDPKVAAVDEGGLVTAVGDGEATITASVDGQTTTAKVKVSRTKEPREPNFRNDIIPILTRAGCNSGACHGALAGKGGLKLSLRGYDPEADHFALTRQANGRRVDLNNPAKSLMLLKPSLALPHGGGTRFKVGDRAYEQLAEWIAFGAPGLKPNDPRMERLEVFPSTGLLKPEDVLRLVVRAEYSDGRAVDVTHLAKFASTEETVAGVDDFGKVKVKGSGETAINVAFGSQVANLRIAVPFAHKVNDKQFDPALLGSTGFSKEIDQLVLKKLELLKIPPSGLCNDYEFIRRACLDATGTLPTPEEVRKFVEDKTADKRAKLIDALLERPEYVDYWSYKWSDLLLVSTRKLPQPAVWAFHQYVRDSVAENKPWDRFARDIVTASGSNLRNGSANYFVLHKDVSDLTEATAVTFLGTSITCARCHNHPLEKWTQDQYWSFANLFSRVGHKNGDRGGEVFVQSQAMGDALHPRLGVALPPTPLDGKPLALDSAADRRTYFADWLTSPDNPYFAKALVNRVWRNFMGRGLVEAEDDLRQTNPPSNQELLDALAKEFIARKYDVKEMIRSIMNTATYQRSSKPLPENTADDRFYSRYLIRRLPAEVVLDAYSQITGVPTPFERIQEGTTGGTAKTKNYPLGTRALQLPDSLVVSQFLDAFGRAERGQTCSCERTADSSVGQALHLNNGQTLNDKLRDPKSVFGEWVKEKITDEEAIRRVFLLGLCREPTAVELKRFQALMAEAAVAPRREVLEDLVWAVLTGREFLFNR